MEERLTRAKARCKALGGAVRVVFWGYVLAAAALFLYLGVRAPFAPAEAFSLKQYGSAARVGLSLGEGRQLSLLAPNVQFHLRPGDPCKALFGVVWLTSLGRLCALFRRAERDDGPFVPACCALVRRAGWLVLADFLYQTVIERAFVLLFSPAAAGYASLTGDLRSLLLGGVLLCLGAIFEYGAALQQQADETL